MNLISSKRLGRGAVPGCNQFAAGLVGLVLLGAAGAASATLTAYTVNGVDLVYDDDLDLTWLADANLFLTQYQADTSILGDILAEVPTVTHSGGSYSQPF
jgi:hypothetical protein